MSQQLPEEWFFRDGRANAAVAWTITAVLVVVAVDSLLSFLLVDVLLAVTAAAITIVPAFVSRSWTRTVPWPLLLLASLPLVLGAFYPTAFGLVVTGVGVAALGMLLVAVLQMTTNVRMTPRFAIAFVILATLSFAGFWALGSTASARHLGTAFVATNTELMSVFTAALVGGLAGGVVFRWFFRRNLRRAATSPSREVETP